MKRAHDRWAAAEKEGSCLHTQRSAKSSPHLLPVTLPAGGRGGLAPAQMHAGIVFLFILSLPCRHVLFFFSFSPTFPQLFCVPPSTVYLCVSILFFFWLFSFVQSSTLSAWCRGEAEQISVSLTLVWFLFFPCLSRGLRKKRAGTDLNRKAFILFLVSLVYNWNKRGHFLPLAGRDPDKGKNLFWHGRVSHRLAWLAC